MSCDCVQVIFLFVHVIVTYELLYISNEAVSIAVRDFFKLIVILGVKLVLTNIIL